MSRVIAFVLLPVAIISFAISIMNGLTHGSNPWATYWLDSLGWFAIGCFVALLFTIKR